jgi:uncharacterized damage-inducible protein DinB
MPIEAWLRGPVPGIDPWLQPAAHALLQVREELPGAVEGLTAPQLEARPGQAASLAFHLRHLAGATDRLLTYARGEQLGEEQRRRAAAEAEGGEADPQALVRAVQAAVDEVLAHMRHASRDELLAERKVGRAGLPSTVHGLLFHIAEHAARHLGQVVTTAKVVRGQGSSTSKELPPPARAT